VLAKLKSAAISFCERILDSEGINRISIVLFSNTTKTLDFTDDLTELTDFINNTDMNGRSDINMALEKADELLRTSAARVKSIVLMTDGIANHGKYSITGRYSIGDHISYKYANAIYDTAVALHDDYRIYTLGFFHNMGDYSKKFAARLLNDIQNAGYREVDDPEDLEEFFEDIADDIASDDGGLSRRSIAYYPLPILPPNFNHSNLNFSTNGGAAIDPITLPTGTTVQLSQYIPLRDGYEFVGWCRDEALTRTITKVQVIDPNTVVYAKWSPIG